MPSIIRVKLFDRFWAALAGTLAKMYSTGRSGSAEHVDSPFEGTGADALELNIYHPAGDPTMSAAEVERLAVDIVSEVKRGLLIPVAVKLSPMLTAFANFAMQLDTAGADGFVLFTRFHDVDIDVYDLEVVRAMKLSESFDLQLRLRGTAALSGRVKA